MSLHSKLESLIFLLAVFEKMLGIGNRSIVKMSIGFLGGFELVHDSLIGFLVIEDANLVMGYRG